jgi:hypothetical protein
MPASTEYMIEWAQPERYDPSRVLRKLPSPISRDMREIYNYSVQPKGFYLIDRDVEPAVAGHAMKLFVDEVLAHTDAVTIRRLGTNADGLRKSWLHAIVADGPQG